MTELSNNRDKQILYLRIHRKKITIKSRKCHAYCYMKYVIQGKSMYHKSRILTKSDK